MSNIQFKAGDKVYFPKMSSKIYTLVQSTTRVYPLDIQYGDGSFDDFTLYGHIHPSDANPSIFLATEENRLLLNKLYGIEFEKLKSVSDVIQEQIDKNGFCLCIASDTELLKAANVKDLKEWIVPIISIDLDSSYPYEGSTDSSWKYAEPIQINSDGSITYLCGE